MAAHQGEETVTPTVRRRGIRLWRVALIFVFAAVVLLAGLRWHWRREFYGRIEALRTAGEPVTPEDLDALYKWPESGDNAANWIVGADGFRRGITPEENKLLTRALTHSSQQWPLGERLPDEVLKALESYVGDNQKALGLLHQAAAIEHSRYPIILKGGFETPLPHLSVVRDGVRTLCFEAVWETECGDAERAVPSLLAALRVADSLADEPILISQYVRCACIDLVVGALERGMNRVAFPEETLQSLSAAMGRAYDPNRLRRAVVDDRCLGIALFKDPVTLGRKGFDHAPPAFILEAYEALGLSCREGVIYLDRMRRLIEAASLVPEERLKAIHAGNNEIRRDHPWDMLLPRLRQRILDPVHHTTLDLRHLAYLRTAQAALAVERFRLAAGGLPDSLGQLVPVYLEAIPKDPFDGEPLRYCQLAPGFVVYSVGEDGKDNGGQGQGDGGARDIVFRVER
jgi:hypothetical protein